MVVKTSIPKTGQNVNKVNQTSVQKEGLYKMLDLCKTVHFLDKQTSNTKWQQSRSMAKTNLNMFYLFCLYFTIYS